MKYVSISLVAGGLMICGASACAEHKVHLRGLFNLAERQGALLEVNHSLARSNRAPMIFTMTRLAKPGEKFVDQTIKGAHVNFEVLEINTDAECVKLLEDGKVAVYGFEKIDAAALSKKLGIELQAARFQDAVDLYSHLKDRTVLLHPRVAWFPVSLRSAAQNENEATAALEQAFLDKGIAAVGDGDKFVLLVPTSLEKAFKPRSKEMDSTSSQFGSIYLESPVDTVIENYARMLGREQVRGDRIPVAQVYLRTGMLSKAETIYAFDRLLEWHGLKVVLIDDKTFKVVRLPDASSP